MGDKSADIPTATKLGIHGCSIRTVGTGYQLGDESWVNGALKGVWLARGVPFGPISP